MREGSRFSQPHCSLSLNRTATMRNRRLLATGCRAARCRVARPHRLATRNTQLRLARPSRATRRAGERPVRRRRSGPSRPPRAAAGPRSDSGAPRCARPVAAVDGEGEGPTAARPCPRRPQWLRPQSRRQQWPQQCWIWQWRAQGQPRP